ncbi:hypothetical protein [Maritimibacter sp. 55A14]|uniref:hypothetical protein n=1 Tax=Maritimibacter sp. 55A14 TaxID=2174844 RepID=UPI001304D77D|nr:hypothetical protein [Maritimibacter sp. 55A14]
MSLSRLPFRVPAGALGFAILCELSVPAPGSDDMSTQASAERAVPAAASHAALPDLPLH